MLVVQLLEEALAKSPNLDYATDDRCPNITVDDKILLTIRKMHFLDQLVALRAGFPLDRCIFT